MYFKDKKLSYLLLLLGAAHYGLIGALVLTDQHYLAHFRAHVLTVGRDPGQVY